jgi:hypothetical protein
MACNRTRSVNTTTTVSATKHTDNVLPGSRRLLGVVAVARGPLRATRRLLRSWKLGTAMMGCDWWMVGGACRGWAMMRDRVCLIETT